MSEPKPGDFVVVSPTSRRAVVLEYRAGPGYLPNVTVLLDGREVVMATRFILLVPVSRYGHACVTRRGGMRHLFR